MLDKHYTHKFKQFSLIFYGSLGIAVIFPYVGAKNAFWLVMPPYVGGTTATPNEAILCFYPNSSNSKFMSSRAFSRICCV
jgi:hypothetical protein